jgi:hypothetical protein
MQRPSLISEGLQIGDLNYLVSDTIHIDEYNSKMGQAQDVVTLSFKIRDIMPANDLVSFLENGYDWILDADVSTGEVSDMNRLVFVEAQRRPNLYKYVNEMLTDLDHLTGISPDSWRFRWYKQDEYQPMNEENFTKIVPLSPETYEETVNKFIQIKNEAARLNSDIADIKRLSGII